MKETKIQTVRKIHNAIRFDYLKGELLVLGLEIIFVFLLLQLITIFIPLLQKTIPNTPLRLNFTISAVIALIYLIVRFFQKKKAFRISKVQAKLGELDELYATTVELTDTDSLPAQAVQEEFIEKAKQTSTYTLVDYKRLTKRMMMIVCVLAILAITPIVSNIGTIDTDWIADLIPSQRIKDFFVEPDNITLLSDEGIYGEETQLLQGDSSLEITLDLSTGGGDYANPLAWQNNLRSGQTGFATQIEATLDSPAIEKLPEEFELAKAYNLKIRQIE